MFEGRSRGWAGMAVPGERIGSTTRRPEAALVLLGRTVSGWT